VDAEPSRLPPVVTGWRARVVELRIWLHILRLAVPRLRDAAGVLHTLGGVWRAARSARRGRRISRLGRVAGGHTWDLFVPSFPSRAFDRFVRSEIASARTGVPCPPHTAILAITHRCELGCAHCFEGCDLKRSEGQDASGLRATLDALVRLGASQVFFSGGEPLLRFAELLHLLEQAGPAIQCWVISSGLGLDAKRARLLKRKGLAGVVISVDSWKPEAHDAFRGRTGLFDAARRATCHALDAGLAVALGLCPTREFTTEANLEAYRRLAWDLGAAFIQIIEPRPAGRWRGKDVSLDAGKRALLEGFYERLCFEPTPNPIVSYPDLMTRRTGCHGGGKRSLYVDAEGVAHPCPFCREPVGRLVPDQAAAVLERLRARGCPEARLAV
jgi:MoaA/NifB/PqqE/SkfB family radical SAM enzyme